MEISVYDTYVPKEKDIIMHFDILVESNTSLEKVYNYGVDYLKHKGLTTFDITARECKFCHIEKAPTLVENEIKKKGFCIIEMENCN